MSTFDSVYGELLTAKEVANLTGLTMNQLRNWRMPIRHDKAPFGFVSIGVSPHYRRVVVEAWLERNGGTNRKFTPLGIDAEFPINSTFEGDEKRRNAMNIIANVTPENVLSVFERLSKQDRGTAMRYANAGKIRFIQEEMPDWEAYVTPITSDNRFQNPVWFTAMVKAMRLAQNEISGLGFSEEEVLALPVGDVPPVRETKG
jgi:hypothetical protein